MEYYKKVWMVMLFGWLMVYANRMVFSSCLPLIMEEFNLSHTLAGLLFTAYFYLYMAMQFPAGLLGDKFGRKRVLSTGTLLWSIIALVTSLARSFYELFLYRALLGLTQGTYFGNDRSIVASYTPKDRRGLGQGVSLTGMGIGMALGMIVGGYVAEGFGWRMAIATLALPSFIAFFLILTIVKEVKGERRTMSMEKSYREAVKSRTLWTLYVIHALIMYPYWVIGTWAPKVFLEIGVKELGIASVYSSLLGISAIPGLIILGRLSDWFEKVGIGRLSLIALAFAPLTLSMFLTGYVIETLAFAVIAPVLIFVDGMFIWGLFATLYSFVADITPAKVYASIFGLLNAIGFISSLIAPSLTGVIRDVTGSFAWGFYVGGLIALAGTLLTLALKKTIKK